MGCEKSKNVNYVNNLFEQVSLYEKYIKSKSDINPKNHTSLSQLELKTKQKLKKKLFSFFHKLIQYNLLEIHKENKIKFLFFITDGDIYYDQVKDDFIYFFDTDSDDLIIRNEIKNLENFIFIHPLLNLHIGNSGASPVMRTIKKENKYLCWSIANILLNHFFENSKDFLKEKYSQCLYKEAIVDYELLKNNDKAQASKNEIELLFNLLNCDSQVKEDQILSLIQK